MRNRTRERSQTKLVMKVGAHRDLVGGPQAPRRHLFDIPTLDECVLASGLGDALDGRRILLQIAITTRSR